MPENRPLEHSHKPEAIARRLGERKRANYVSDWIYGGIDGAITTFAIVAGSLGADLSSRIILILGGANILADGFSMAAANFAGTRAENDDAQRLRAVEERHIRLAPHGEAEEIRQIFAAKGFSGQVLEDVVKVITADRTLWVDTMMTEEYGISLTRRSPWAAAMATFFGFMVCGIVPLLPFILKLERAPDFAVFMTIAVFFAIGVAKTRWSTMRWWASGLETLAIGLFAAGLAYVIGDFLNGFL